MRTPSIMMPAWPELVPRMKMEACPPNAPLAATETPGMFSTAVRRLATP